MTVLISPVGVETGRGALRRRARRLGPLAVFASVGLGVLAGRAAVSGEAMTILGLAAIPVVMALATRPRNGVLLLLAVATLVEQFPYFVGARSGVFTSRLGIFSSVTKGSGLSLFELLLGLMVAVWLMHAAATRSWNLPRSPVARALALFMGLVALAVVVGLAHGGTAQVILYEVRPWIYLATGYVLASSLLAGWSSGLRAIMWTIVLGTGFKAIQGLVMWVRVRNSPVTVEGILAHEESFFFGLFLILTLALWIFGVEGRLRTVATLLLPLVLVANMANSRRTAWAIIGTTLLMMTALAYAALPRRRRMLRRGTVICLAVAAVYIPAFWNASGLPAQPARALRAQFSPDARDASSNLYREQEDANLLINIQRSSYLGTGFGPLIEYVLPITDISEIDPFISFLPHNSVLDMWMRMGSQGVLVFVFLLGAGVIRACRLVHEDDEALAAFGAFAVCTLVAYVVQGYTDMGFFWFRIALFVGIILGAVEVAHRKRAVLEPMTSTRDLVAGSHPRPSSECAHTW